MHLARCGLRAALVLVLALASTACTRDAEVAHEFRPVLDVSPTAIGALDVLFVIDNSGSMLPKQQALAAAAREQVFSLLEAQVGTMPDLHVGVITTDMGAGTFDHVNCNAPQAGALATGAPGSTCDMVTGHYLVDVASSDGSRLRNYTGEIGDAFGCLASVGTSGCGFEQPLAAMRAALDPDHVLNPGFLRSEAMLLVVFVTDEDDCSAGGTLFDPTDPTYGALKARCWNAGVVCSVDDPNTPGPRDGCVPREGATPVVPISTYADFLRGLKADPSMIMVATIAGNTEPVEIVTEQDTPTIGVPGVTCETATAGSATPPVRLAALAAQFSSRYSFSTICDLGGPDQLAHMTLTVAGVLTRRRCLLGPVPASPTCRAYARKTDGNRVELPICTSAAPGSCVAIEPDLDCDYTPSHLGAHASAGLVGSNEHLVVECVAPTGL
ncbi:MAG: hypothetical protein K8W52_22055 [Deltaproteobacteria bacterium]|nr:hypothetical protein [Deltaproteobacteria bacterium]